jgi:hypothetical protein
MDDYDSILPNEIVPNSGNRISGNSIPKYQMLGHGNYRQVSEPASSEPEISQSEFPNYDLSRNQPSPKKETYGSRIYNRLLPNLAPNSGRTTGTEDKYLSELARFYSKNNPGRK